MLQYQHVFGYMPDRPEFQKCPRQWIINVCYTMVGQAFGDWVSEQIEARNERLAEERDLMIQMDP